MPRACGNCTSHSYLPGSESIFDCRAHPGAFDDEPRSRYVHHVPDEIELVQGHEIDQLRHGGHSGRAVETVEEAMGRTHNTTEVASAQGSHVDI